MKKTWLWLEDQYDTVADIKADLEKAGVVLTIFSTADRLVDFIIGEKKKGMLDNYGLIVDLLLMGTRYITCPQEWTGSEQTNFYSTERDYDGGLLFCERVIMNLDGGDKTVPHWNPPPPIIFLTVVHTDYGRTQTRLDNIKKAWANAHNVNTEDVKIEWIEKWNAEDVLIQSIKKMEA